MTLKILKPITLPFIIIGPLKYLNYPLQALANLLFTSCRLVLTLAALKFPLTALHHTPRDHSLTNKNLCHWTFEQSEY
jgi:hypothetical protein